MWPIILLAWPVTSIASLPIILYFGARRGWFRCNKMCGGHMGRLCPTHKWAPGCFSPEGKRCPHIDNGKILLNVAAALTWPIGGPFLLLVVLFWALSFKAMPLLAKLLFHSFLYPFRFAYQRGLQAAENDKLPSIPRAKIAGRKS
jgi:hypothetical protein